MRYFTSTHEWVERETSDGAVLVMGISDYGQSVVGDVVYVDVPEDEKHYAAGDVVAVIESSKAALDIYTPISGTAVQANKALQRNPECVNKDPFGEGWVLKLQVSDLLKLEEELQALMDEDAYAEYCRAL